MIPIPPSHWLSWRQKSIDWDKPSTSVRTVAPVVVNPDIDSKYASSGLRELLLAAEQVRQRADAGRDEPRERDDEEALADAEQRSAVP